MKKTACLFLALLITAALAACGGNAATGNTGSVEKCDLDMSKMNTTMAYSQISNIMENPGEYLGKTIKMKGTFQMYKGVEQTYYICEISDSTACCSAGMEFVLENEPPAYPGLGTEITVTGEFETYLEKDEQGVERKYCHLVDAKLG